MKDKKWIILVVCALAVICVLLFFLTGKKATVTFDSAGGSLVNSINVKVNGNVSKPVNPTREGYTFVRWELNDKEYDFSSKITGDITLKAIWEKVDGTDDGTIYKVTLNIDGKEETIEVKNGKIASLPSPSKEGYVFVGWYDGSKKISVGDTISKDLTLTAKFEKQSSSNTEDDNSVKYTVTFDSNGGSKVSSQKVVENKTVSKPKNPTRSGYAFVSWELDGEDYDFSTPVTNDITLKAVWAKKEDVKEYTVTFDSDGGTKVSSQTVVENKKVSKPKDPTKSKYKFLGWYLDGKLYSFDTKVTKNITLKAKWEYMPELIYKVVEETGTIVGQARVFLYADGEKTEGYVDITTDAGKYTVKITTAGYKINKDKVKKVDNLRLK